MALPNELHPLQLGAGSASSGYQIEQSLRFNDDDTAHFDRTPSSVGARQTWTYSVWVKGSDFSGDANTLLSGGNYAYGTYLWFRDGGHIALGRYYSGSYTFLVEADGFYRDPTAWYHIVCVFDSGQATASNRVKLYVNGEQITSFTTASYPSQHFETDINNDGIQWIGERGYDSGLKLHGYLAETHLVDGSPLEPTSFGEYDGNGVWRPIEVNLTGPNDGTTWSDYLTDSNGPFDSSYPATKAFNGSTDSANVARAATTNTTTTFEPPTDIPYTSSVEVWTYYAGSVSLNGGSAVSVSNDQFWRTIATGSGSLDTLTFTSSSSSVYLGAIRVDGVILIDGNTHQYGKNGFYLKFDPTAANGIGHDHSGNGNNWTANNFSTSGTGTDVMSDTPTKNFNTLNPAIRPYTATPAEVLSDGNLKLTCSSSGVSGSAWSTMLITSGKWYWEATLATAGASNNTIGWCNSTEDAGRGTNVADLRTNGVCYVNDGDKVINVTKTSYGDSFTTGDAIGAALDADTGTVTFYKNGVSQGDITGQSPQSDSAGWLAAVEGFNGTVWETNFGQREFLYPPGTASATSYFNTVLYTGNNSTNAITGVGFAPDFVWIKPRNLTDHHRLNDIIRGPNRTLNSNETLAEYGPSNAYLDSFDSDGFTVSSSDNGWNNSSYNYVAWCWKAGGTPSSNTDGTITSSVSANQDAGFSIVTYSGTSTDNATIGHGLGVEPAMVIVKNKTSALSGSAGGHWLTRHKSIGMTESVTSCQLFLNLTNSLANNDHGTLITSGSNLLQIKAGGGSPAYFHVGETGNDYVAYCWAEKPGVTKIGSYEGNGLASGLSVDVGFKPAMVIIKNADAIDDWNIIDNRTSPNANLRPNSTSAEDSAVTCYLTPTGFTVATGNSHRINYANETFIYIAFAENFSADDTYKALNTANLPAPEIEDGSKHFSANTWTGNGTTDNALTGFGHQPDFVWGKARNQAYAHALFDSIRGGGYRVYNLGSTPPGQDYLAEYIKSFDSDGITLGSDGNLNGNNVTYAGWSWKGGGTVSADNNTDGTITTTVSANPTGGFSVIKYNSNNSAGDTIGHGLNDVPAFFIIKNIDASDHYATYHQSLGNTKALLLNSSNVPYTGSVWWNNTTPNSTTITLGTETSVNNSSNENYICWAWTEVEGYSKFGSYTGNGSTDGVFIYTGFKPSFILYKRTDSAQPWYILDTTRDPYNVSYHLIGANLQSAEDTSSSPVLDFVSNGIKLRNSYATLNADGGTFIYAAFAENPFGGSGVSPATAR